ncbi:hypothetical protein C0993_003305 [Termitomyces sp. T159_Od127]|nr:hypothetical protein C0993_003305 [Termitomyces sp. T159_Od127]
MKGWILAGNLYDQSKLVTILTTAALTSKQSKLKSTTLVVAFLLKANITNHISDTLAEAVATKTIDKISMLVDKLGLTADFLAANDAK